MAHAMHCWWEMLAIAFGRTVAWLAAMLGLVTTASCAREPGANLRVLPGEFEPVAEVLLAWDTDPHYEPFFADLVALASSSAPVTIFLGREQSTSHVAHMAKDYGADMANIRIQKAHVESVWMRDYGPLVVRMGSSRHVVDAQYFGDVGDDEAPKFMAEDLWDLPRDEFSLDIEGGNIISDGAGLCLTTSIVIEDNGDRLTTEEIKTRFTNALGCRDVIFLSPLAGEPTGHIDMFATLTGPREAIVGSVLDTDDENAQLLDSNAAVLSHLGFKVRRIPMPENADGRFRTYTNALTVNDLVIVPVYPEDERSEAEALAVFAEAYPDRTILPIVASEIIELAGAVHCVGMTVAK